MEASAGTAYVDFKGDFSSLNKQIAAYLGPLTSKFGKLGTAAGAGLGVVAGGAVAAGAALYDVGEQFDQAYDVIRVKTGATGKRLEGLKEDFRDVVKDIPADFADAGTAVGELSQRLGLTGKPLQDVSKRVLELSRLTETDLSGNIAAVSRLFADWSVKTLEQPKALDKLFRASQATGIEIGKLSEYMVQFGSPLRQMGFDFDTAAAMFSKFEKEGVNLQTAMPGLRMALKNFAKDGKDPADALEATIKQIQGAATTAEANTMAFEIFGTRAGPDLAAAIREGRFEFSSLIKTIDGGKDTIMGAARETDDFNEKWQIFKNRVMVGLEPLAMRVFGAVGDEMERVSDILTDPHLTDKEKFSKLFSLISGQASEALSAVAGKAAELAPEAAEAFVHGFLDANIWGKLVIGGLLISRIAPLQDMIFSGSKAGTAWARSFADGVSTESTYALSRSFGRGRLDSAIAQTGAFGSAGVAASRSFASSFAADIAPSVAAIGIGNIATSAMNKDWQDAGFEAGGALAGGIAGFMLGGPFGAMLGVGVGSIGGELGSRLFDSIFSSGRRLSPLQKRLQAETQHLTEVFRDQRGAVHSLASAHDNLEHVERRQRSTTTAVNRAEERLSVDRKKYGADSNRVRRDEVLLAQAKHRNAEATKEVSQAHQLSGHSLELYNHLTVVAAASTKNRIRDLREESQNLFAKWQQEKNNNDLGQRALQRNTELNREQKRLSNLYQEAAQKSGPALQHTIEHLSLVQANYGKRLKGLSTVQAQLPRQAQSVTQEILRNWGLLPGQFKTRTVNPFETDIRSMAKATSEGLGHSAKEANEILTGFGVNTVNFHINNKGEVVHKQTGGFIVPGSGDGDRPGFAAPPKSFVLNREATRAMGFDAGGMVPLALEAGERLFTPGEVSRIGRGRLEALNAAIPRFGFQDGGLVEPQLVGPPGALTQIGQAELHNVFKAASRYVDAHKPKGALGVSVPAGPIEQMARQMILQLWGPGEWAPFAALETREAGWNPRAVNPSSGAAGLAQALPPSKYPSGAWPYAGPESAKKQLEWMMGYIRERYGSPSGAWAHEQSAGWYQLGGLVQALVEGGQVASISDWRGIDSAGLHTGIRNFAAYVMKQYPSLSVTSTTGGEHAEGSFHPLGEAVDLAGGSMDAASSWIKSSGLYKDLAEGIHNPNLSVENGSLVAASHWGAATWADHADHIHLAVDKPWQSPTAESGAHSFKEDVPAVYHGARTDSLHFGSIPDSLHGIRKELTARRHEISLYRRAAARAHKENKPGVEHAISKNITALEGRIHQLEVAQKKQRIAKAKRKFSARMAKKLARITGFEDLIAGKERTYNIKNQRAEQLVELEPLQPELPASATDQQREAAEKAFVAQYAAYINGQERPAFGEVLGSEADWRNTILQAERLAAGAWEGGHIGGLEGTWEGQITNLHTNIDEINDFTDKVAKDLAEWRQKHQREVDHWRSEHPGAKSLPDWLQGEPDWLVHEQKKRDELRAKLPMMRFKEDQLRGILGEARESFYPGGATINRPDPPLAGSGSFEDALENVQGIHWPDQHEFLTSLPPSRKAGLFGGAIWDTQASIEELDLKIRQAAASAETGSSAGAGTDNSEREALLETLLREANERNIVRGLEETVFGSMPKLGLEHGGLVRVMPPYAGKAHTGAVVPGPPLQEKTMVVRGQERIRTPEQELAMAESIRDLSAGGVAGADSVRVQIHGDVVSSHPDPIQVLLGDRRLEALIEKVNSRTERRSARSAGRGLAGRAGVLG